MPITPYTDKQTIMHHIITDPYILSLGFNESMVYITNTTADKVDAKNMQILVFNAPSRDNPGNDLTLGQLIEVNVIATLAKAGTADLCIEQIIALCDGYEWHDHSMMTVIAPSPVPLACPSGFYCVAARFIYFTSKINQIKTVK